MLQAMIILGFDQKDLTVCGYRCKLSVPRLCSRRLARIYLTPNPVGTMTGDMALRGAATAGNLRNCQRLVPSHMANAGLSALCNAVEEGHMEVFKYLVTVMDDVDFHGDIFDYM